MKKSPFKEDGFQHYYLRNAVNQPYGVVALAPGEDGKVHRGIALCSSLDAWDRMAGRRKAVGRVKKAMAKQANSDAAQNVDSTVVGMFSITPAFEGFRDAQGIVWKSGFNVEPTSKEKVIIENLQKKLQDA